MITAIIILSVLLRKKYIEVEKLKEDLMAEKNFGIVSEKERSCMGKAIGWFYARYNGEIPHEVFCWGCGFEPEDEYKDD